MAIKWTIEHSKAPIQPTHVQGLESYLPERLDQERLSLVLTGDIARSLLDRGSTGAYSVHRDIGMVGAKALVDEEGRGTILMNAAILVLEGGRRKALQPERIFAHESWHVALGQRGEDPGSLLRRKELDSAATHLVAAGSIAAEEYRIETHLWSSGMETGSRADETPEVLSRIRQRNRDGHSQPDSGEMARIALASHSDLNTHLACCLGAQEREKSSTSD